MIASYWGHNIETTSMRRRFSISIKGTSITALIAMANSLFMRTRPVKLGMQHLGNLKLPCILHWDMNHFVVLKSVSNNYVLVHDPAVGIRRLSIEKFSSHFTGIALELIPTSQFSKRNETNKISLFSILGPVTGLKIRLFHIFLLGIALQVCVLTMPFYIQWLVDEALVAADSDLVTILGIGFLLLVVFQTSINAVRSWFTTVIATNLNFQWLGNVFAHLMRLPISYFEKRHIGDITSRFNSIQIIQHNLSTQFVDAVIDGLLALGTAIIMSIYSAQLTAVACTAVMLYMVMRCVIFHPLRNASSEQIIYLAKQQTYFFESVRGVQSIRLFGRSNDRHNGWMNFLANQFNAELRIRKLSISYQSANNLLFGIERIAVIWLAALAVLNHHFSIGMLLAFISFQDQFNQRITSLIDKAFDLRMLVLHAERIADILMTEVEPTTLVDGINIEYINASIEFRNVSFRYAESEPYIIKNINLIIPSGQCIAIAGASGCGKTTLVKILSGLLRASEGEILVGGVNIDRLGLVNHQKSFGAVMQEDTLFTGSIGDNISFFNPSADQERIQTCATMAAIHKEITNMTMGYHTLVGDIGTGLSGGQKQRILLARALYKNPKFLILDEATSHLDSWNEQQVNSAIQKLQLTRIIVAHRPETIAMTQRVVVLQDGKITQDEVLK